MPRLSLRTGAVSLTVLIRTVLAIVVAGATLAAVSPEPANAVPAGEDQYLEQVPDGGGQNGADREIDREFAESVGADDGIVSKADVRRAARERASADREAAAEPTTTEDSGSPIAGAALSAGRNGPNGLIAIVVLVSIASVSVVALRTVRARR